MPKLHEVIGDQKKDLLSRKRSVLSVRRTVKLGLTKVGNQAKSLKYSEKKLYFIPI